jgi:hypothetical protein
MDANPLCGTGYLGSDRPRDISGKKTGSWTYVLEVIDICRGGVVAHSKELEVRWQ